METLKNNGGKGCTYFFFADTITISEALKILTDIRERFRDKKMTVEEVKQRSREVAYKLGRTFNGDEETFKAFQDTDEWRQAAFTDGLENLDDVFKGLYDGFYQQVKEIAEAKIASGQKISTHCEVSATIPRHVLKDLGNDNSEIVAKAKADFEQFLSWLDTDCLTIKEMLMGTYNSFMQRQVIDAVKNYMTSTMKNALLKCGVDKRVFLKPDGKAMEKFIAETDDQVALYLLWPHHSRVLYNPNISDETLRLIAKRDVNGDAEEILKSRGVL